MPQLYKACNAFVLPTRGEGWGLPVMEAMSMELYVEARGETERREGEARGRDERRRIGEREEAATHALTLIL